jgi:hypothetical protein
MVSRHYRDTSELIGKEPDVLLTPKRPMREVLAWLATSCIAPSLEADIHPILTLSERNLLAQRLPHRTCHTVQQTWRGASTWQTCATLGGHRTLVVVAQALPVWVPWDQELLFEQWREIAGVVYERWV